jgi:hypothetical protein
MLEADPLGLWIAESCRTSLVHADAPRDGRGVLAYARRKDQSVQAPPLAARTAKNFLA